MLLACIACIGQVHPVHINTDRHAGTENRSKTAHPSRFPSSLVATCCRYNEKPTDVGNCDSDGKACLTSRKQAQRCHVQFYGNRRPTRPDSPAVPHRPTAFALLPCASRSLPALKNKAITTPSESLSAPQQSVWVQQPWTNRLLTGETGISSS